MWVKLGLVLVAYLPIEHYFDFHTMMDEKLRHYDIDFPLTTPKSPLNPT